MCGRKLDFIQQGLDFDWKGKRGPNVIEFEKDLEAFVNQMLGQARHDGGQARDGKGQAREGAKRVAALASGTAAVIATISADIIRSSSMNTEDLIVLRKELRGLFHDFEDDYSGFWARIGTVTKS